MSTTIETTPVQRPVASGISQKNGSSRSPSPVNILLVDDRDDKTLAIEAILSSLGQNIVKANSGKEALRHLLQKEFAVILLDVAMPGMDGFETAELIRQRPSTERPECISGKDKCANTRVRMKTISGTTVLPFPRTFRLQSTPHVLRRAGCFRWQFQSCR